ncbi:hypothetical protein [Hymenobacter guriensis]|uniref:Uncharacterized protein n=1 Tax=Hymenobacter guriensis TaxID=2793065 RepID=A0ABS0KVW4_9BACT|nr:hypothetical protein [Hymenobacter guriensis]MBG8552004.1 hypothetical protein [Hymenobacter guriensis]
MRIEFLDDLTDGGKFPQADSTRLVRLFDFDKLQASQLRQIIQEVIIDSGRSLDLSRLNFIQVVNCNLMLRISDTDKGILMIDTQSFVCDMTIDKYREMIRLLRPFCDTETSGYQWLYDLDTPIDFLFSPGGFW